MRVCHCVLAKDGKCCQDQEPTGYSWASASTMHPMLAAERAKVAADEAKYECQRCSEALEPDYGLSDLLNRIRAWMWRQAHRLNCR